MVRIGLGENSFLLVLAFLIGIVSAAAAVAFHELIEFILFFQAEDGIRDLTVTGVQTCALPISHRGGVVRDLRRAAARRSAAVRGRVARRRGRDRVLGELPRPLLRAHGAPVAARWHWTGAARSEEHTSELQSQSNLVCRLLLEKKKKPIQKITNHELTGMQKMSKL